MSLYACDRQRLRERVRKVYAHAMDTRWRTERYIGPPYHFFTYKGVRCGLIQCLLTNSAWVAFVVESASARRVWSERYRERPFGGVGIDFEISIAGTDDVLVGFHTQHLLYDTSLPGMPQREVSVDHLAKTLRTYIDRTETRH